MFRVIDDVVPKTVQQHVAAGIHSRDLPWYHHSTTIGDALCDPQDTNLKDTAQWVHVFIDEDCSISEHTPVIEPLLNQLYTKINFKRIVRVKANLITPTPNPGKYHAPHIDAGDENITSAIYYVNDSDGDTWLFNKTAADVDPHLNLHAVDQVSPRQGRVVIFPGRQMHAGSSPRQYAQRTVINFVFET